MPKTRFFFCQPMPRDLRGSVPRTEVGRETEVPWFFPSPYGPSGLELAASAGALCGRGLPVTELAGGQRTAPPEWMFPESLEDPPKEPVKKGESLEDPQTTREKTEKKGAIRPQQLYNRVFRGSLEALGSASPCKPCHEQGNKLHQHAHTDWVVSRLLGQVSVPKKRVLVPQQRPSRGTGPQRPRTPSAQALGGKMTWFPLDPCGWIRVSVTC